MLVNYIYDISVKKRIYRWGEAGGADGRGFGASRRKAARAQARGTREARVPRRQLASIPSSFRN